MSHKQKRIQALENQIRKGYELLSKNEERLNFESNPNEQERLKVQIKEHKQQIADWERELDKIHNGDFSSKTESEDFFVEGQEIDTPSSIHVGDNISIGQIGDRNQTIINNQESKPSFYLRLFLLIFVPLLALGFAYLYYQYQILQKPLNLSVKVKNLTPNPKLADPQGTLTLNYGDKSETQEMGKTETIFKGIPPSFWKKKVQLSFKAEGFVSKDTFWILDANTLILPIERNQDLAKIFGYIKDERNQPLEGAKIRVQNLETNTDATGYFELHIPFDQQRDKQRLSVSKTDYQSKEAQVPVKPDVPVRFILDLK